MISAPVFQNFTKSLIELIKWPSILHALHEWICQDSVQEWIRQNIVEDDPWDQATLLFGSPDDRNSITLLKKQGIDDPLIQTDSTQKMLVLRHLKQN